MLCLLTAHILHLHCYKILGAIICQLVITFIKWTHFVRKQTQWWQQLFSISKFAVKGAEINQEGTLSHHGYLWNYKKEDPLFCEVGGYLPWSGTLQVYRFQTQVFYSTGFQSFMTVPLQHWRTYRKGRLWYIIMEK